MDEVAADGVATGRTTGDAPQIDGVVSVAGANAARPGDVLQVEITGSDEHDLRGRVRGTNAD